MRVVVQRVKKASCLVEQKVVGKIDEGFMLLVGFKNTDTSDVLGKMAQKINNLRVFDDQEGKMNLNIHQINGKILSISQFTLYADTKKSNRPSFTESMKKDEAISLYEEFNKILREEYGLIVETGCFGEHMYLDVLCDGPVTINLEI